MSILNQVEKMKKKYTNKSINCFRINRKYRSADLYIYIYSIIRFIPIDRFTNLCESSECIHIRETFKIKKHF